MTRNRMLMVIAVALVALAGAWPCIAACKGTQLQVNLNGEGIVDVDLSKTAARDRPLVGHVSLQDHGLPLWFRNIRVKELK